MDATRLTIPTGPGLTTPTAEEEERLRGRIRAELERQRALPVAARTLALLAEAAAEPIERAPHYRIIDRRGAPRLHPAIDGAEARPLSLSDLVDELRSRHPDLFAPPLPPEPEPEPEPPRDPLADVKAAGARFVETQSALARSLATQSAERGRAFATAATGRFEGWRSRLGSRLDAKPIPTPGTAPGEASSGRPRRARGLFSLATLREGSVRLSERGRDGINGGLDRVRSGLSLHGDGAGRGRVISLGLGGLTVLAVIVAIAVSGDDESPGPPQRPPVAETARAPTPEEAPAEDPKAVEEARSTAEAKPADEASRNPAEVAGIPEVIDTATLRVSGKLLHLFGVEWVRGGQADELTKYLAGRSVSCLPAPGSSAFTCTVEGRDVSEVVLFNGGGRASSEASTELVAAEDHARTERLGVWKR